MDCRKLEKQYADDNAEFISIKKSIPSEDMVAVQAERYTIRDEYTKSNIQKLQEKYGRKYSYDIYKDVEADVNMELHEKPFSILIKTILYSNEVREKQATKYRPQPHKVPKSRTGAIILRKLLTMALKYDIIYITQ